jgi:hypothetical protein
LKLSHLSLHLGKRGLRSVTDEYLLGKQAPQLSLLPPKGIHHIDCCFRHLICPAWDIMFCKTMRGNGSGIGEKMDANAIGFAGALPIFVLLVIALAIWLQRQTG